VAKSALVAVAMVVLFFVGQPVAKVAIVGGALLLLTRRVKAKKVYEEIDGPLLLMFAGLFVVIAGVERHVLTPEVVAPKPGTAGLRRLSHQDQPTGQNRECRRLRRRCDV